MGCFISQSSEDNSILA